MNIHLFLYIYIYSEQASQRKKRARILMVYDLDENITPSVTQKINAIIPPTDQPFFLFEDYQEEIGRNHSGMKDRQKSTTQGQWISYYDNSWGFGIPTRFGRSKPTPSVIKQLLDSRFHLLRKHLLSGRDAMIPYITDELALKDRTRYYDKDTSMFL